jgi:hypothetical protein
MSGILTFISAVVGHWLTIMTGIASILIGLLQYWTNKRLLPPAWIGVGILILFIATYQSWLEEHGEALNERCNIEKFERRSEEKNQLAAFMDEVDKLVYANLTHDTPPDQVSSWFSDSNKWIIRVHDWVKDNLGPAAVSKAMNVTNILPMNWDRAISPLHNSEINILSKIKQNLSDLIGSPSWDDFDTRINLPTDACAH